MTVDKLAWTEYDYYINDRGWLVVRQPNIIKAKLKLWDCYFLPSPTNNLITQILKEDSINQANIIKLKKKNKRDFWIGVGLGSGVATAIILVLKSLFE